MSTDDTSPAKDTEDRATGDEPATAAQISYLGTLAHDSGRAGVTLLTATKRYDISQAAVLADLLDPTRPADDA